MCKILQVLQPKYLQGLHFLQDGVYWVRRRRIRLIDNSLESIFVYYHFALYFPRGVIRTTQRHYPASPF